MIRIISFNINGLRARPHQLEALKEKYSMETLSPDEKRELQQILLKKDKMSIEEASLLKNLSSK